MIKLNIKPLLESKNFSVYRLAKEMDIPYATASILCKGNTTRINFNILDSLCKVLDCTPNDIFLFVKDDDIKEP